MHVPMKFNRLILFRPWFFHDAGPGFGTDIRTGRLVYLLFYFSAAELERERREKSHAAFA